MSKLSPARYLAVEVGAIVRQRNAFTAEVLDSRIRASHLNTEDIAFSRLLALGVTSTYGVLDEVINRVLRDPSDINDDVRDCLRVSTYEMIFLDKADHAAVDQGVELVRAFVPKAARLANAVLRKILAERKRFPYGNPENDDAALARSLGFPLWLAQNFIDWMGRDEAARFMSASNQQAPVFFATNPIKLEDDTEFLCGMAREGHKLSRIRIAADGEAVPGCYLAASANAVGSRIASSAFNNGQLIVSDAAAQAIAQLAVPREMPTSFLEVGAGRGTKTILMQSEAFRRWGKQMNITCLDARGFKADLLAQRASEYGIEINKIVNADARKLAAPGTDRDALGEFDTVFIDAPCSGLGTLRRHPELRWRLNSQMITQMGAITEKMLEGVAPHVKVGGRLVYATCTVAPVENELALKGFLESAAGKGKFRIEPCPVNELSKLFFKTRLTEGGSDAHFAAVLRRIS